MGIADVLPCPLMGAPAGLFHTGCVYPCLLSQSVGYPIGDVRLSAVRYLVIRHLAHPTVWSCTAFTSPCVWSFSILWCCGPFLSNTRILFDMVYWGSVYPSWAFFPCLHNAFFNEEYRRRLSLLPVFLNVLYLSESLHFLVLYVYFIMWSCILFLSRIELPVIHLHPWRIL